MSEGQGRNDDTATKSYPALLWRNIKSRKAEFFFGLFLSIVSSTVTVWLQYRDGMLERKHFWDGVMTTAVPVLGIIVIVALVELCRAAASLHRAAQGKIDKLEALTHGAGFSERDAFVVLAGQLREFLNARDADYAIEFAGSPTANEAFLELHEMMQGSGGERASKRAGMESKHNASTLQTYGDRFAARVLDADRRLRQLGVNVGDHLAKYPTTVADIEAIIRNVETAATALPSAPVSDVGALQAALINANNEIGLLKKRLSEVPAPRSLTRNQIKIIAERLRQWPAYQEVPFRRRVAVAYSPSAPDGKAYAEQIRLAFTNGSVYSDEAFPFDWGSDLDQPEEWVEQNAKLLEVHVANVTVCGSEQREHEAESLEIVALEALHLAKVDAARRPDVRGFAQVTIVIGSGAANSPP